MNLEFPKDFDPLFPTIGNIEDKFFGATFVGRSRVCAPIENVKQQICQEYDITIAQLVGERRDRRMVEIRHEAIRRAAETGATLSDIGRAFNRDHTTITYVLKKQNPAVNLGIDPAGSAERLVSKHE